MNDNDILIARQEGGTTKTVVVDGEAADFERMERRKKERQEAEIAKAKQYEAYLAHMEAVKKAKAARQRNRLFLTLGLVLSVTALMALTLTGLMHTTVGTVFIAGAAAAFGWQIGRNR